MRSAQRRKVNVLEMKCLTNLMGMSRMIELGMKRCVKEQELKESWRIESIREYCDGLDTWREWMGTVWQERC